MVIIGVAADILALMKWGQCNVSTAVLVCFPNNTAMTNNMNATTAENSQAY